MARTGLEMSVFGLGVTGLVIIYTVGVWICLCLCREGPFFPLFEAMRREALIV